MLLAAIDIGTNSIHMVIARTTGAAGIEVVDREREVVQLGRGSFAGGRLRPDAVRATLDTLARFVRLAQSHQVEHILCSATAAVREAANGGDFLGEAEALTGVMPRVIPAEEEGRLIYLAIRTSLQLDERPALIVDIGGGSMQLVVGNARQVLRSVSAPLGALRLTERLLRHDPPRRSDLQRLSRFIKRHARAALSAVGELAPERVYGSSGSIRALAEVAHWRETGEAIEQINGHVLTLEALNRLTRDLESMSPAEREQLRGLDAKRAEIIVPGAYVLRHVLRQLDAGGVTLSDFGLREGLLVEYVSRHAPEITALDRVPDLKLRSALQLVARFGADEAHARHVAKLALQLFDGLRPLHALGPAERELLRHAALVHDVGTAIGHDGHAEHSYYVIRHGSLRGFSPEEIEFIANVARYHAKRLPRKRDEDFRALKKRDRGRVRWLAAILRLAEALDRSQYQVVEAVRAVRHRRRLGILVGATGNAALEIWAARPRTDLLTKLTGLEVQVTRDRAWRRAPDRAVAAAARAAETKARSRPRRAAQPARGGPGGSTHPAGAAVPDSRSVATRSAR